MKSLENHWKITCSNIKSVSENLLALQRDGSDKRIQSIRNTLKFFRLRKSEH